VIVLFAAWPRRRGDDVHSQRRMPTCVGRLGVHRDASRGWSGQRRWEIRGRKREIINHLGRLGRRRSLLSFVGRGDDCQVCAQTPRFPFDLASPRSTRFSWRFCRLAEFRIAWELTIVPSWRRFHRAGKIEACWFMFQRWVVVVVVVILTLCYCNNSTAPQLLIKHAISVAMTQVIKNNAKRRWTT